MTYNIHPIFVHFPIALLFVYSIIKIVPFYKWIPGVSWKHIERALLLFGVLGAFAALSTGEIAEHMVRPNHDLVETHAAFASTATWMYALLLLGELLTVGMPWLARKIKSVQLLQFIAGIKKILTHNVVSMLLAIIGLITITVAGLLGGVMVYGTTADPAAAIVLKILGISL